MNSSNKYICPICTQGYITIEIERTGPLGFRTTDFNITNKTCECITYNCETIALAITSYTDRDNSQNETCESCGELEAIINYPINMCSNCFKIEMKELEEKHGKY